MYHMLSTFHTWFIILSHALELHMLLYTCHLRSLNDFSILCKDFIHRPKVEMGIDN